MSNTSPRGISAQQILPILKGAATLVPGAWKLLRKGTGGTDRAAYCYGVWLKHLVLLKSNGLVLSVPRRIAEIGPGDSLGVGIAALLSGAEEYHALDVVAYSNVERSLRLFEEMVELFRSRAPRPLKGWPDFDGLLDARLFPGDVLTESLLSESLRPDRLAQIRAALSEPGKRAGNVLVTYAVPWTQHSAIRPGTVDYALSHSVLEHVVDLEATYSALARWLRPGGLMSHQIDFTSHGICEPWNGHRTYGSLAWRVVVGGRSFLINRQPPSVHLEHMRRFGFTVVTALANRRSDGVPREDLDRRFHSFDVDDLQTVSCFIQARLQDRGEARHTA